MSAHRRPPRVAPALLAVAVTCLWFVPLPARALDCTVTAPTLDYGSINPVAAGNTDASTQVTVTCSELVMGLLDNTVGVCVAFGDGTGGADASRRFLGSGGGSLPHNLYKDAARAAPWGSATAFPGSGAVRVVVTMSGLVGLLATGSTTVPLYGRVPAPPSGLPAETYTSTYAGGGFAIRYGFDDALPCDGATGSHANGSMLVTATLAAACTASAQDLAFGGHAGLDAAVDATSAVQVHCTSGVAYAVRLSAGTASRATVAARRMTAAGSAPSSVAYGLYTDPARSQPWGDGTVGTIAVGGNGTGAIQSLAVYGRVPGQATPEPGRYADQVVVTVEY